MSVAEERMRRMGSRWRGGRRVIFAAAFVFGALVIAHVLPVTYAIAGFAITAAAPVLAVRVGIDETGVVPGA